MTFGGNERGAVRLSDSDSSKFLRITGIDSSGLLTIAGSADNVVADSSRLDAGVSGPGNRVERVDDSRIVLFGPDSSITDSDRASVDILGFPGSDAGSRNVVSGNRQLRLLFLNRARENKIIGNSFFCNPVAVSGVTTSNNVIRGNMITADSVPPQSIGAILLMGSTSDLVEDNEISGPTAAPGPDDALRSAAIWVHNANGTQITGNRLSQRERGVQLTGSVESLISRNVIDGVTETGIFVYASDRNEVTSNKVTSAGEHGIEITSFSDENLVERNHVTHSGIDGVTVLDASATGNVLARNTTRANGDDGIDVDQVGTTITRNHSIRNFDWGIEAVAGTLDGGGNRAAANGQRAQCLNVVCGR
jgi:parallel beta-helix repeat protein